ncbi:hypothetical protein FRC03_010860 [Tulasnella sp. 419]|nr:hypothetical protein FRC03_010860 [Tulasnella sp. 419]
MSILSRYIKRRASYSLSHIRLKNLATMVSGQPLAINKGVEGVEGYFPLNEPKIGTPLPNQKNPIPKLFTPLKIRKVEFKNRIFVSPMCQYSAKDGALTDWHFVHLGSFATRGVGAIVVEATSVVPEGRLSPEDSGIWSDDHIDPLKRIVNFAHSQGVHIGIQLAHGGRKSSGYAPWAEFDPFGQHRPEVTKAFASREENGWPDEVYAPSEIPFSDLYAIPKPYTVDQIKDLQQKYVEAIERCKKIGFDFIELHYAHGYLAHEFLSPLSNNRTDEYGGSLENRLRFPLETAAIARKAWGEDAPLFVRISATDWAEGPERSESGDWRSWGIEQSRILSNKLKDIGVDLIDVSSGGNWVTQKIAVGPMYQVPFAEAIHKDGNTTGAVGLITTPQQAESILQEDKADVIFLARELLRNADWALDAAQALGIAVKPANQYERAWTRMIGNAKL